jgi:hypothetical protein
VDSLLREFARVARAGAHLTLFHPTGRVALAARRGRTRGPDEPLDQDPLRAALTRTGWALDRYDDAEHRFYARATRVG